MHSVTPELQQVLEEALVDLRGAEAVYDIVNPSTWAGIEYPGLMANRNVTGIKFNLIDESGSTIWSAFVPK